MAIDPSISLAVRAPVIPAPNIQSPLDRFAQVLSLRNLMTQGQLGQIGLQSKQLELQQLQREIEQQDRINKLLAGTSSAAAAPLQTATIAPSIPPVQPTPSGGTVAQTAPATAFAPAGTSSDVTTAFAPAGDSPTLRTLMAPQAPDVMPTAPAAPVPGGRAPSAAAISIPDPYAGLPSDAEIIRQGGTNGFTIVKNLNAGREAFYKQQQEKIKLHQSALTGMASLAAGAHDEPSKVEAIAAAFNNGWIDGPTRDQLMSHPYNKKEWDDFAVNSLEGDKRLEELRKQVNQTALEKKQAHDQAMYPSEEARAVADATKAGQEASGTQPITPQQAITNQHAADTAAETARHNKRVEELTGAGHTQQQATALANIEGKLRDDFTQATKTYPTIRDAYGRIQAAKSAPPSGASDIALLYGYMKVLDPGSTVREGEFKTASEAGGVPDWIATWRNRILNGERLSPNVRTEMMDNVERLYGRATEDYNKTSQQFTDIAKRSNADPRNVIINYTSTAPASAAPAAVALPPPKVGEVVTGKGGQKYTFIGGDVKDKNNYKPWTPVAQ